MATGLARQGVMDSADENLRTERQQKPEDAVTELVRVPAGLTEEAVKGAEVFEAAQLSGLNDPRERTAAGTERIQAQINAWKEEKLGWVKQG
jgi:hypothetical protein